MNVSIVGTGYVGLVSGACLAEKGHQVTCVDTDASKVSAIMRGVSPFHEPGLDELLKKHVGKGLKATTDLSAAMRDSELTLIAVGTPFDGKTIDLTYIRTVSRQLGEALKTKKTRHTVVVKSTVVPGTTTGVVLPILEETSGKKAGVDFGVGMNPEFLTEGEAVGDFMIPDRIVIGGIDEASLDAQAELYAAFTGVPVIRTNPSTAEMIKYVSNCLLANLISFSNEIGNLCAALGGTDVADVMKGVHTSRYLTPLANGAGPTPAPINSFLWAGCGFGGSCLPKDVAALQAHGEAAGVPMRMLGDILKINGDQPRVITRLLGKHFPSLKGVRIAVLGLAFRQDTDDLRHTPAVPIINDLTGAGADVVAYDPKAMDAAKGLFAKNPIRFAKSLREALTGVQAAVLVTRWGEFKQVPELLRELNPGAVLVDGRRMLDPKSVKNYEGVGRVGGLLVFTKTTLAGVFLVGLQRREDDRGFFARGWCQAEAQKEGLNMAFVQSNIGFSTKRGTVRGMHYQSAPHAEVKLVRCTMGSVLDVAVDLRPTSPTHKQWFAAELSAENRTALYIPEGVAHGYMTLTDAGEIVYETTAFYAPTSAKGVRFNDPAFGIAWPLPVSVISEQDRNWPDYLS